MEAKHTPGPWTVQAGDAIGFKTASGGSSILASARPTDEFFVLKVAELDTNAPAAEAQANGRLIAAAPDLLERLQIVTETLASLKGEDWETIKRAREVIAKATGEQPRDQQSAGDKSREEP